MMPTAKLFAAPLLLGLFFVQLQAAPPAAKAEEEENYNLCTTFTKDKIAELLQASAGRLRQEYGRHAQEPATQFLKNVERMAAGNQLLVQAPTTLLTPDTTSMPVQWQRVFKPAAATADSIEALCNWIVANMVSAEHRPDLLPASAQDIYTACMNGSGSGDAYNFSVFLAKVSLAYPHWGVPVVFKAVLEVEDTLNGPHLQHSWVGFAQPNGTIWCLADVANGGVVRHANTGAVLSLDTVRAMLGNAKTAPLISVRTAPVSLQSTMACVFSFMLRNEAGLVYLSRAGSDEGFARGAFYTPAEPGFYVNDLLRPIWIKKKMAAPVFFNFYALPQQVVFITNHPEMMPLLGKRYNLDCKLLQ